MYGVRVIHAKLELGAIRKWRSFGSENRPKERRFVRPAWPLTWR